MSIEETVITVRDIERLRLEPGDVLVYVYPGKLRPDVADVIRQRLREVFKANIPIAILDGGARLQVVNKNELDNSI